jgi:chaperonin GroEL
VHVGAATEVEMKEKKARVEDALNATRAAVEEGVVPGGGVALLRCLGELDKDLGLTGDKAFGVRIVRDAIQAPLRSIAENAGVDGALIVQKVLEKDGAFGWNAQTEEYGDMFGMGIIDPTKVVRSALQNAASVSSLLLTTEAVIAQKPEKKKPMAGGGGGGGGMGGMGGMGDMGF